MVVFLGFYAAAELSHFVEIVPRVPVSAVKWKKFGKMGYRILSIGKKAMVSLIFFLQEI